MANRRTVLRSTFLAAAIAFAGRGIAKPAPRVPRVALVSNFKEDEMRGPDPIDPDVRAFVHGLRDLGLVDGRNIVVERRSDGGVVERMPAIMQELVKSGVDVIVTTGGPAVWAAHRAASTTAIVGLVDDVLDMGIIDSLARPGHNLTGIGETDPALHGKRLQLIKEAAPAVSRVAILCYTQGPNDRGNWRRQFDAAAKSMSLDVLWLNVDRPEHFDGAFATILRERANAIYATSTHVNVGHAKRIASFALTQRLPSFGIPEDGMLLGYWADSTGTYRQASVLVKKILDGAKPGDLPFEQPAKFDLVLNLRTAAALGLSLPRSLLLRASQVIQ